ncbi:MAG: hypothetical protein A3J66_00835 [Candidatus Magasanikbacteria bacterium RIFCSPHIGHO2_02_FULL_47_14]|uniref:Uncharacterized protein n=1 Tax=Candidatus Magasanikbacteria bacterium RIFCSPHIGHO2_02_FULL_47_14 TaxID=1798680 RepID=A0A1F6M817_9BACT|nr:MAG: hypothetical protein A3J66_00835 [Candidatus Magasanikbacteria bacterium RIFCSPHIGHO2_02_FULL_47_14]
MGALAAMVLFLVSKSSVSETRVGKNTTEVAVPTQSDSTGAPVAYDPTVAPTVQRTGWNTYSNPEYDFAFAYPPEYELSVDMPKAGENVLFSLSVSKDDKSLPSNEVPDNSPLLLSVERGAVSDGVNILTNSGIENVLTKTISLNGFLGKWVSTEYGFTGDLENHILLEDDKKQFIHIYYYQYSGGDSPMHVPNSVFDTILQSIRPYL